VAKAVDVADAAKAADVADAAKVADTAEAAKASDVAGASKRVQIPVEPNINPFAPTQPVPATEFPPGFLENPQIPGAPKVPHIPEPPPGGFPELPPSPASDLTGMRGSHIGTPTGEIGALTEAEIDAFIGGLEGDAQASTFFEMPGQNPATGGGLQDIREVINPNPNQINYSVNHYFGDVGEVRIGDMPELTSAGTGAGESLLAEGAGTTAQATPQTSMVHMPGESPVLNSAGEPIGSANAEVRYHSTNPRHPAQGPTVQVNSPSDRFGWQGDRSIAVEGEQARYLLPDGRWLTIGEMTEAERAMAHWPVGR
jgi:hypothetical protein